MAIRAAQGHQLVFVSSTVGYTVSYFILLKSSRPQCYKNYKILETPFHYRREQRVRRVGFPTVVTPLT